MKKQNASSLDLKRTELSSLTTNEKVISLKKGEILLRPDDPLDNLFYIKSGFIYQYAVAESGQEFAVNIFHPGSIIPFAFAMHEQESLYYFEALSPVRVVKIKQSEMLKNLSEDIQLAKDLVFRFAEGLNYMSLRMESLIFGKASHKVASAVFLISRRFQQDREQQVIIGYPLPHRLIAAITGLTRETVSGEMVKLKKADICFYKNGKVKILNMKKLKEVSSFRYNDEL